MPAATRRLRETRAPSPPTRRQRTEPAEHLPLSAPCGGSESAPATGLLNMETLPALDTSTVPRPPSPAARPSAATPTLPVAPPTDIPGQTSTAPTPVVTGGAALPSARVAAAPAQFDIATHVANPLSVSVLFYKKAGSSAGGAGDDRQPRARACKEVVVALPAAFCSLQGLIAGLRMMASDADLQAMLQARPTFFMKTSKNQTQRECVGSNEMTEENFHRLLRVGGMQAPLAFNDDGYCSTTTNVRLWLCRDDRAHGQA